MSIDKNDNIQVNDEEVTSPPFEYLIHVDLRKYNQVYIEKKGRDGFASQEEEDNFLICCGGGSCVPERAARAAGVEPKVALPWAANFWLSPWELTKELLSAALALAIILPNGKKVVVL